MVLDSERIRDSQSRNISKWKGNFQSSLRDFSSLESLPRTKSWAKFSRPCGTRSRDGRSHAESRARPYRPVSQLSFPDPYRVADGAGAAIRLLAVCSDGLAILESQPRTESWAKFSRPFGTRFRDGRSHADSKDRTYQPISQAEFSSFLLCRRWYRRSGYAHDSALRLLAF